ncbi:hypothetical protein WT60_15675 [Burkholderia sp. MSMB617WGS]|nr:hypothetical protein WT60_15675 [Burkholderia sp. MSMB617WGS]
MPQADDDEAAEGADDADARIALRSAGLEPRSKKTAAITHGAATSRARDRSGRASCREPRMRRFDERMGSAITMSMAAS